MHCIFCLLVLVVKRLVGDRLAIASDSDELKICLYWVCLASVLNWFGGRCTLRAYHTNLKVKVCLLLLHDATIEVVWLTFGMGIPKLYSGLTHISIFLSRKIHVSRICEKPKSTRAEPPTACKMVCGQPNRRFIFYFTFKKSKPRYL